MKSFRIEFPEIKEDISYVSLIVSANNLFEAISKVSSFISHLALQCDSIVIECISE